MRLRLIPKYLILLLSGFISTSFQAPKTSKIEIKNLGLSKAESAKVLLALKNDDVLKLTFRDRNGNIIIDKNVDFTIKKIPSLEIIRTGKIGDRMPNLNISANGDYILEVNTQNKKDQFYNVTLEKISGKWLGDKPPITVKSTLLEPPSKGLDNKLCISYPVSKNTITALVGEGKNANGITVEVPQFQIKSTMDKGFQQAITEPLQLDVFMYLDPENLKSKGVIDKIMSLGKKDKKANLSQFCEVKTFISETKQNDATGNPLSSKPASAGGGGGGGEFPKTSEKPLSIAEMNAQLEQARKDSQESLKQMVEGMKDVMRSDQKVMLLPKIQPPIIQNLLNQFDFTVNEKRKCTPVPYINESDSQFFGYWIGISSEHYRIYRLITQELKLNDPINNPTPLSEYSNGIFYQKGIHDQATNLETRPFPIPLDDGSIDNVEIALVDNSNKLLFESGLNYASMTNGLSGNTGQLFGFKSITNNSPVFLCSCNHNKQSPVSIYAIFETYTLPQIQ